MNKKKYFTFDAISFGFKMFRQHHYSLFKLSLIIGVLLWGMVGLFYIIYHGSATHNDLRMILDTAHNVISGESAHLETSKIKGLLDLFIMIFIIIFIGIGDIIGSKIAIMLYDKKDISHKDIFACWRMIPRYFGVTFLCSNIARITYRLFVGFGFLTEILFKPCTYFVIDKNVGVNQALKSSIDIISRGRILDMCIVSIITLLIMLSCTMLSNSLYALTKSNIIAFMITCYMTSMYIFINACVYAFFYRKLLEEKQMQLTPATVANEDYNQISIPDKTLQP